MFSFSKATDTGGKLSAEGKSTRRGDFTFANRAFAFFGKRPCLPANGVGCLFENDVMV